jgi:hypothetical protein
MRWADEQFVKVYTRDTVDWLALSYDARSLFLNLLRKVDRAGLLPLGRHGRRGVAVLLGAADLWEGRIGPALAELELDGCVRVDGPMLVVERFPGAYSPEGSTLLPPPEGVDLPPVRVRLRTPEEQAAYAAEHEARVRANREASAARHLADIEAKRAAQRVYFIAQDGPDGLVKIGTTRRSVEVRRCELQKGHARTLVILASAPGGRSEERHLHDRFAALRVSGEWFRQEPALVAYINLVADRGAL